MGKVRRPAITDGEARTHWFLVELRNLANPVAGATVSALITLWTVQPSGTLWDLPAVLHLIVAALVAAVWLGCYFTLLRPRYSELARKNEELEADIDEAHEALQDALDSLLMHLLKDKSWATPEHRISTYSVEHDRFVLLSRRSVNPMHERRGRSTYALEKGVIGLAWQKQSAKNSFDVSTREEWEEILVSSGGFTAEEAASLTMFSRSILAIRIDTAADDKVGMLVIEAEGKEAFDPNVADSLRRRPLFAAIVHLVAGWHEHFPRAKEWQHERDNDQHKRYLTEPEWKNPAAP